MSGILTTMVDRLCNGTLDFVCGFFTRHAEYVHGLEDNLEDVKTNIDNLMVSKKQVVQRIIVEEHQQRNKKSGEVNLWLERVDKAIEEGQELIKSGEQELQRLCLGGYCSTNCWSTSIFGKEVQKLLNVVRDLLEKSKEFDKVIAETPAELVVELPCDAIVDLELLNVVRDLLEKSKEFDKVIAETPAELVVERPCDAIVGLETKVEEVWTCLESKDVIGVYGIEGVGKTTLLTQIHNKFADVRKDVLVIWVVVGKDTQPEKIQENIANKIDIPVEQIFNKLSCKKFVLFLDDIWKRVDLTKIEIPAHKKLNGSKIIFSIRLSKVCNEMRAQGRIRVEILAWEDAWKLFKKHVGEDTINVEPEVLPLVKSMVDRYSGLPIAIKIVGRAMSGKLEPREWRHSIRMLKESSQHLSGTEVVDELVYDMEVEVLRILKFSYEFKS